MLGILKYFETVKFLLRVYGDVDVTKSLYWEYSFCHFSVVALKHGQPIEADLLSEKFLHTNFTEIGINDTKKKKEIKKKKNATLHILIYFIIMKIYFSVIQWKYEHDFHYIYVSP